MAQPKLSVTVPIRNEEKNIPELHERILATCNQLKMPFEVIYVENASTDNSRTVLKSLQHAKIIILRWKPYMRKAQSLAMDAGFKAAKGDYIVYLDGDLQVAPEEIPRFIKKLDEGYDVVCGWRKKRKETETIDILAPFKNILRGIFTFIRKRLIDEGIHDPGSAIKAFKREALEDIDLYGEMHRFLVAILKWQGFSITELEVEHFPRKFGKSHYTLSKGFQGFADLLNVFIWRKYSDRPLHLFGVGGLFIFSLGILSLLVQLLLRWIGILSLSQSIFPILSTLLIITGLQLFLSGVVADNLSRVTFLAGKSKPYTIQEVSENT
ncbi:glycosyltransferase family 2 protein [Candidatus Dojkabacteria bacterium]|uniref:Glycosyltransferase family 2 protein n=1 Tax=Candidatus Dojkabacteria bacterium TaxID=2099670 RepID=A0A955RK75_9BACT|nr:glycosyltransferase family 2 protein [Candidatus Dojkabacteria bacterium]